MISIINMALLTMLAVVTVAIARQRSLFGVVVLASIYSFLIATVLVVLDAVDVAMTEASVGAGISTVLLLAALHLIKTLELRPVKSSVVPFLASLVTGGAVVWGALARGDQCSQPGISRSGRLSRLRYAWRNHGDIYGRNWGAGAACGHAPTRQRRTERIAS